MTFQGHNNHATIINDLIALACRTHTMRHRPTITTTAFMLRPFHAYILLAYNCVRMSGAEVIIYDQFVQINLFPFPIVILLCPKLDDLLSVYLVVVVVMKGGGIRCLLLSCFVLLHRSASLELLPYAGFISVVRQ